MWEKELNEYNEKKRTEWQKKDIDELKKIKTLFHYTDTTALKGIVSNHCLWATNIRYLNDKMELKYALNLVVNTAKNLIYKHTSNNAKNFLKLIIENGFDIANKLDLYIISLSNKRDLLSQWRGYGKKYNSVCIGFNIDKMDVNTDAKPYNMRFLQKVIYEYNDQISEITNYLDEVCAIIGKYTVDLSEAVYNQTISLFNLLARIKHSSWKEEDEWRIVVIPEIFELDKSGNLIIDSTGIPKFTKLIPNFKIGDFGLIPYLEVDLFLKQNGINEILLPQSENYEKAKDALAMFLSSRNIFPQKDVAIEQSAIPIVY